MDTRDLLARFLELSPINFMNYFKPSLAKKTKSYLIFKKTVGGHKLAFVYRENVKLFYCDRKLAMSCPVEDNDKLAA